MKYLILTVSAIANALISLWIGQQAYSWFPVQAAAESHLIDQLFSFLVVIGSFIFFGVTGALLYSVVFHRVALNDTSDGPPIEGNVTLEVVWTVIPILLVVWIASYSYQVYDQMSIRGPMEIMHLHMPKVMESAYAAPWNFNFNRNKTPVPIEPIIDTDLSIDVIARQWAWEFHYPYKNVSSTELHIPANQRVHLALKSEDVLHGFYIPAFRLKQDIIPKRTIDFEFTPIREGKYRLMDSQFSGTYFAAMDANVVVDSLEDYQNWLNVAANRKPAPAKNQAAAEYAASQAKPFQNGWQSVIPAAPPVVNYSN
jgi:cytochrome c oxidase subunit II